MPAPMNETTLANRMSYLDSYKGALADLDLFSVMRAANEVEAAMGIAAHQLKAQTNNEADGPCVANQRLVLG